MYKSLIELHQPPFCQCNVVGSPSSVVYNMDCIEGMKYYPDKHFDLAVVDPPYGIGHSLLSGAKRGSKFNRNDHNVDWDIKPSAEYFLELFRVSKEQIIFGANYYLENLPSTKCFLMWDKVQIFSGSDFELAWTSFDKPSKAFRMSRVEAYTNGTIHPTQKPTQLYNWIFHNYATEGMKILDTHLGSQSSRISANKAKLHFVGFETNKQHFENGNKRYDDFVSQVRLF